MIQRSPTPGVMWYRVTSITLFYLFSETEGFLYSSCRFIIIRTLS